VKLIPEALRQSKSLQKFVLPIGNTPVLKENTKEDFLDLIFSGINFGHEPRFNRVRILYSTGLS
jgi:hypothetical protein